ncbi:hypothetical protein BBK36DRAFT_1138784 [Trichoderma citrinoviride]|uniref:Uncharacterized protein n=1 Tax=Trichoderma citrinoviride TaxID=58853 RepID=A0A2T4BH83_9HYPO|nr:hypothetical protein BBK36DRAFT_1138784 [Trichoderma citrinoviride]PTB68684.1 hypothetical protein BBK36DRAFT_1138784 [Trichoderma citrinoviride]
MRNGSLLLFRPSTPLWFRLKLRYRIAPNPAWAAFVLAGVMLAMFPVKRSSAALAHPRLSFRRLESNNDLCNGGASVCIESEMTEFWDFSSRASIILNDIILPGA